jgi:hypothetical protein
MENLRWVVLTIATGTALHAQKYVVNVSPTFNAGQSYAFSATASTLQQTSTGERVLSATEYQVKFDGRATVMEVDGKGQRVKTAFTVDKFTKTEGHTTSDLLKAGSVILVDGRLREPVSLKDGPIAESVREAFALVSAAHKPDDATDEEVFGAREAKGIGESWSINSARASESAKDAGLMIPAERISGTVSLVAKDKIAGIDCLSVHGEFKAELQPDGSALGDLPPGFTIDRGTLQAALRGCYPLDPSRIVFREGLDFTMQLRLTSKEGVTVDSKAYRTTDGVWGFPETDR